MKLCHTVRATGQSWSIGKDSKSELFTQNYYNIMAGSFVHTRKLQLLNKGKIKLYFFLHAIAKMLI